MHQANSNKTRFCFISSISWIDEVPEVCVLFQVLTRIETSQCCGSCCWFSAQDSCFRLKLWLTCSSRWVETERYSFDRVTTHSSLLSFAMAYFDAIQEQKKHFYISCEHQLAFLVETDVIQVHAFHLWKSFIIQVQTKPWLPAIQKCNPNWNGRS